MNTELLVPQSGNPESEAVTPEVDRRDFMTWVVAGPAALTIGAGLITAPSAQASGNYDGSSHVTGSTKINSYLSITPANKLLLTVPRVESGQGIFTSSAILVAQELGVDVKDIDVRGMSTAEATEFTTTLVGASGSTRLLTEPTRAAAAELKARLKAAGATAILPGNKVNTASGQKTFAEMAAAAAAATPASKPYAAPWKYEGLHGAGMTISGNVGTFVIGDPNLIPREDSDQIYTGTRRYTCDVENDALNVLVMHSLQTRGSPKVVDTASILALKNSEGKQLVKMVIPFDSKKNGFSIYTGVGLVCDTMGDGLDARDQIMKRNLITWNPGTAARFSTPMLNQKLKDAVGTDPVAARLLAAKQIKGGVLVNFHHQGTLGTQTASAEVFGPASGPATGAMAWWGSQVPKYNRQACAQQIGLDLTPTKVVLQITPDFGHFGRNLLVESSAESMRIGDAVRKAGGLVNKNGVKTNKIKLNWSRNDDIRMCPYRPPTYSRYIYNIGSDGKTILSCNHKFVSILCELPSGVDNTQTEAALSATNETGFDYFPLSSPSPYSFVTNEAFREVVAPFPTGAMRAVYSVGGQGGKEVFMDEVARQTQQNRWDLRLKYMKSERIGYCMKELTAVWKTQEAAVAAWNADASKTTYKGIGFGIHEEWNSAACTIVVSEIARSADITVTPPTVRDAWISADVGKVTNPSGLAANLEGPVADAVAMVYFSKITFTDGAADQSTFLNYYWNRMRECTYTIHPTKFVNINDTRVGGAGELNAAAAFGAVANAWGHLNQIKNPDAKTHYAPEFPIYGSPSAPLTDA